MVRKERLEKMAVVHHLHDRGQANDHDADLCGPSTTETPQLTMVHSSTTTLF